jgi:hypothetical protein
VDNYRVSTNTNNNSNKTTQDKTNNKKQQKTKTKIQGKINQLRIFTFTNKLLKISVYLQTALAAETNLTEG